MTRSIPHLASIALLSLALSACTRGASAGSYQGFQVVDIPAGANDVETVVKQESAKAKASGLKPFVYVGAPWCGPCRAIRSSLRHPLMVEAFKGVYLIRFDLDEWEQKLEKAGYRVDSIPVLFALNGEGRPNGKSIGGGDWGDNVPENMAPALKQFFTR